MYQCYLGNHNTQGYYYCESIQYFCTAITVQFEEETYMVEESDGMVDVRVAASGRTSFEYTFTITPMDLSATSKFDSVFNKYKLDGDCNGVSTEVGW